MSSVIILCRDLRDSELSEFNYMYDSDESSDSVSAVAGVARHVFSNTVFSKRHVFMLLNVIYFSQ